MEFNNNKAIYLQISDILLEYILKGNWNEGDRIPSVRQLAVDLEVNPNTVMRTYTYLQEQEIIFNKRGVGYFIAENAYQLVLKFQKEEFFQNEVPTFFKTMKLLKVSWEELQTQYLSVNENV